MPTIFEPRDETPEGWRKTFLGTIACFFGWHFGQIVVSDFMGNPLLIECARCKKIYKKCI